MEDEHACYPGDGGGVEGGKESPAPRTGLVLDGGDGGYAGEVEHDEDEIGIGREWGYAFLYHHLVQTGVLLVVVAEGVVIAKRVVAAIEHADG